MVASRTSATESAAVASAVAEVVAVAATAAVAVVEAEAVAIAQIAAALAACGYRQGCGCCRVFGALEVDGQSVSTEIAEDTKTLVAFYISSVQNAYFAMPLSHPKYDWTLDTIDSLIAFSRFFKPAKHMGSLPMVNRIAEAFPTCAVTDLPRHSYSPSSIIELFGVHADTIIEVPEKAYVSIENPQRGRSLGVLLKRAHVFRGGLEGRFEEEVC